MSVGGFTLADRLGAKAIACRVKGCTRTWIQLSNKALALGGGATDPNDPGAGMCEPCRGKLKGLRDQERACERPGCGGTWTWPVTAQLEAFATRKQPPRGLCADCESRLAGLETKEIPCTVPGCQRTAVLTPRAQLMAPVPPPEPAAPETPAEPQAEAKHEGGNGKKGEAPRKGITLTGPLCAQCEDVSHRIKDRSIHCGINGCSRKWIWKADEQIQVFAAGKPPDPPPRRMCEECRANFGKLLDREVRCRTSGCKKIWTWTRSDQLDACVANKSPPKAPARMCDSCFQTFSTLKDVERPCRRAGCKGTWTDKRGAQLARAVRGKTGDPYPHYCTECDKELGELQDREISCKTENCPGTWTWSREQQLAAGVKPRKMLELEEAEAAAARAAARALRAPPAEPAAAGDETAATAGEAPAPGAEATPPAAGQPVQQQHASGGGRKKKRNKRRREPQPPDRRCSACAEFLAAKKTLEIPCSQCSTPIYWPPESQLQAHLGNWAMPSLCGACKRDATEAARLVAKEQIREELSHQAHPSHAETAVAPEAHVAAPPPAVEPPPEPEPAVEPSPPDGAS